MTKALLLLTGGRGVPDLLVVKYLHPDVILDLTTPQGLRAAQSLKSFVENHFDCQLEILPTIDPYNEQNIKSACRAALQRYPDAEWVMHFTSSPKVVGIYAHDIAREYNIPYWFLDTDGKQVISLVRESIDDINYEKLYKATVEEYIGAYGRTYEIPKAATYRQKAESWFPIAKILAQDTQMTEIFLKAIRGRRSLDIQVNEEADSLLQQLEYSGVLTIGAKDTKRALIECSIRDGEMLDFLSGDWLEVYVWAEATNAGFADDCQWGYKIVADIPSNELDLALTYKARLLIAECKTSGKPFNNDYLYKLHSISDLIGGNYVRQIFITHYPRPESREEKEKFDNFCQQANIRRVSVITGDQLLDIRNILQQQIGITGRSF
jgi:hypothetical protein